MNLSGRSFLKEIDFTKDEFARLIDLADQLRDEKRIAPRAPGAQRAEYRTDLREDVDQDTLRLRSGRS